MTTNVYHHRGFFFETLGFIEHTHARKINYDDALIFEQIHKNIDQRFGFDITWFLGDPSIKGVNLLQRLSPTIDGCL